MAQLVLALLLLLCAFASPAWATVTVVNTVGGAPVLRVDTDGNAVDAHDGDMLQVGNTFYLYGTSYGCGYIWRAPLGSSTFCGFKVYTSTDLITWTNRGNVFDATVSPWVAGCNSNNGCFRPHVKFNVANNNYVMWVFKADAYVVLTSSSPLGPFVIQSGGTVAGAGVRGDMGLFVDNNGDGYLIYTVVTGTFEIFVQKLTSDYLNGTGSAVAVTTSSLNGSESPALIREGSTYYAVFSQQNCAFCSGAPLRYATASSPLGTWSAFTVLNANACNGQSAFVATLSINGSTVYLWGADTWFSTGSLGSFGLRNQGQAKHFWIPLTVSGGTISAVTCDASFTAALTAESPPVNQMIDQTAGTTGFSIACDGNTYRTTGQRVQTFVPATTQALYAVSLLTYQNPYPTCNIEFTGGGSCPPPDAGLTVDLVTVDGTGKPVTTLKSVTLPVASFSWSPTRTLFLMGGVNLTGGSTYGIYIHSTQTAGCYGLVYNDANPYPAGNEYLSVNSGSTFTNEPNRAIQFADLIFLRGLSGSATLAGSGRIQ